MAQLLWLNGTFGIGKTTTARLLDAARPDLRLFDPEAVGYVLRHHLADQPVDDFQDWPSWRRLVPVVADELVSATGQGLIVVQTVLVEDYWREVTERLRERGHEVFHVLLEADARVLRSRIDNDAVESGAAAWRRRHILRYDAARPWLHTSADLVLDTTALAPPAVAARVEAAFPTTEPSRTND